MKPIKNFFKAALTVALLVFASVAVAQAQTSGQQNINLNYNVPESLTLTVSPASVTFTPGSGNTAAAPPISISITYAAAPTRSSVGYVAYLPNTYALQGTSSGTQIPVGDLYAWNSGTSGAPQTAQTTPTPCTQGTQTVGAFSSPAGQTCDLTNWLTHNNGSQGTLTDNLNLELQNLPSLPVDSYSGQLVVYAALQ